MEIKVCIGDFCHVNGAEVVVKRLKELIASSGMDASVELKGSFCMRKCQEPGVTVQLDDKKFKVMSNKVDEFFNKEIKK